MPAGSRPIEVAITPHGAFAYVSNSALFGGVSSISVISTATNIVEATVPVGLDPQRIAFLPNGRFAYVANQLSNTVSVIETANNTVVTTIPVGLALLGWPSRHKEDSETAFVPWALVFFSDEPTAKGTCRGLRDYIGLEQQTYKGGVS